MTGNGSHPAPDWADGSVRVFIRPTQTFWPGPDSALDFVVGARLAVIRVETEETLLAFDAYVIDPGDPQMDLWLAVEDESGDLIEYIRAVGHDDWAAKLAPIMAGVYMAGPPPEVTR